MSGYLKRNWETFPMEKLKRVARPTTLINEDIIQRVREREAGFCKAAAGDYGPKLQKEFKRFVPKHPLSGALSWMRNNMRPFVDGVVAAIEMTALAPVHDQFDDQGKQEERNGNGDKVHSSSLR